jgi:hypothetical protein
MRRWLAVWLLICPLMARAAEPGQGGAQRAYRTDTAGQDLPWYKITAGVFPPLDSAHQVGGELVEADYIHRSGQFRRDSDGELVSFSLPPFGTVSYLNAGAELRDVPLGTHLIFFLYQDEGGAFTQAATIRDDYTRLAKEGLSYRRDAASPGEGKLHVTQHGGEQKQIEPVPSELKVDAQTKVWKGSEQVKLADLAPGDELLVNFAGGSPSNPSRVSDIWVGGETQHVATETQRKRHLAFLKMRGLPARIDAVDKKKVTVTFLGDPAEFEALCKDENFVPSQWATEHRGIDAVVANEELRSYNPPVDRQRSAVQSFANVPTDGFGSTGVQWVIQPDLLLEGFRKGRILRLFVVPVWPVNDMPFGESMYTERPNTKPTKDEPNQYSYRTDFGNRHLPWYRLEPGKIAPVNSAHVVGGELVKLDAADRSGQFRADGSGSLIDFRLPPFGTIWHLGAEAELKDLSLGTHYLFYLNQDDRGAMSWASVIMDDYSSMTSEKISYRLEEARLAEGKLMLATQLGQIKDDRDEWMRPPDVSHGEFAVDGSTRVWKGDKPATLADLVPGDELLVNMTGRTTTSRGRASEIWAGADTLKLVTQRQREAHNAFIKEHGAPAWIDSIDGKQITLTLFAGNRDNFRDLLNGDPWGGEVFVRLADEQLRPVNGTVEKMAFRNHLPEGMTAGTYGASGIRWVIEPEQLPAGFRPGQAIRVFKAEWPGKDAGTGK